MSRAVSTFRPTVAVFVAGLLATLVIAQLAMRELHGAAQERLERRATLVTQAVQSEVDRYEDALTLVAASAGSTPEFTREQFDAAVAPLAGMGLAGAASVVFLAPPVGDRGVARLEDRWRARGATDLRLVPAEGPDQHFFSIMSRPLDGSSQVRTGIDVASAAAPRSALVRSANEGGLSITTPYPLLIDQQLPEDQRQAGFSIVVPVRHAGRLRGWILLGLRGQDFAGGVLRSTAQGTISARLTARDEAGRQVLVADLAPSYSDELDISTADSVAVAQRRWTVTYAAAEHQAVPLMRFAPWPLVAVCLLVTFLLALLVQFLSSRRTRAEERAQLADAQLAGVTARLEDFIWSVEVRPDRTLPLEFFNTSAQAALHVDGSGEDLAARLRERTVEEDLPRLEEFFDALAGGEPAEVETRLRADDGTVRWMWTRANPRHDHAHGAVHVDGITSDVHRRKVLDQQRNQFLAIAGHEMRTPLTIIRGYAEYLAAEDLDPVARRTGLEAISRRSRQMELLLSDFFDLSRLETGVVGLDRRPVRLDEVLSTARDDFEGPARDHGVDLDLTLEPVTVSADPMRLRQVVDNLLDNAVKYSRPGGTVRIHVGPGPHGVQLAVSDDGIGVPQEEVGLIFDRFYRATNAESHVANGTGLGLSVVAAIVHGHGGGIKASSPPGQGLTVTVTLPVAPEEPEEPEGSAGSAGPEDTSADSDDGEGTTAGAMLGA